MKLVALAIGLLLIGCSADDDREDEDSVLYDAARQPLDKAEAVQDAALDAKDKVDRALEESEGDLDD